MNVAVSIKLYILTLVVLIILDVLWISVIMKRFYTAGYGAIARKRGAALSPRIVPGLLVWMLIALGLTLFVFPKITGNLFGLQTFIWGALLGLVIYGVYDLTNYSVLQNWSLRMTVVDIIWGTAVCGIAASVSGDFARLIV